MTPSNRHKMKLRFSWAIRNGFTLMELLVVVAIVGILASLLLGSVNVGVHKARQAQCVSNLRQIAAGLNQYMADNNMQYPAEGDYTSPGIAGWGGPWYAPTRLPDKSPAAYLGGVDAADKLIVCPENRFAILPASQVGTGVAITGDPYGFPYVVNYGVMPTVSSLPSSMPLPYRTTHYNQPSQVIWMADGLTGPSWGPGTSFYTRVGTPHNGFANVLWLDSHVSQERATNLDATKFTPVK